MEQLRIMEQKIEGGNKMNGAAKIEMAEKNIRNAIFDYGLHSSKIDILSDVSETFIHRLAVDNYEAKSELRDLFRKSPAWNEELDAIVINGTRTHEPDYKKIMELCYDLFDDVLYGERSSEYDHISLSEAVRYFTIPNADPDIRYLRLELLKQLAPHAYHHGRKDSRVLKIFCETLGIDKQEGFSRKFAALADEMNSKKIDFKLFVSLNPAHFITMSNPKDDERGDSLTSCHSFNCTDYEYNNGCSGYARDHYTFIVFTVADPSNPELLNNRKAMRQIFCYKPGNGVLLQSRLYNDTGGVNRELEEAAVYRDLIQREISALENQPNLWKTVKYYENNIMELPPDYDFGGYADWTYEEFCAKLSIRADHASDCKPFTIGAAGLCIKCGDEISSGLYCDVCTRRYYICSCCGERVEEDDSVYVHERDGGHYVCNDCCDRYYVQCDDCEEYYPDSDMTEVNYDGQMLQVCSDCLSTGYHMCDHCGTWTYVYNNTLKVVDRDGTLCILCDTCIHDEHIRENGYTICVDCDRYMECHGNRHRHLEDQCPLHHDEKREEEE